MKIFITPAALACLSAVQITAQVIQSAGIGTPNASAVITESGPDYRIWRSLDPARSANPGNGHMVEIATGMNFWNGTNWSESVPAFEASAKRNAFVANRIQHRARVSFDINVQGAISVSTPNGQVLSSTPIAIGLYDAASGQSLVLATITNTPATLVSSNQVYFENAFRGGACASILYTIERDSFAQDIVFSGYLDPAAYGFPTNSTRVQIITEFYQPPRPEVLRQPMYVEGNPILRAAMASPDLMDETLSFDRLVIGVGEAYTLPTLLEPAGAQSLVAKEFTQTPDGRYFLIESVPYSALQSGFYLLPDCSPTGPTQGAVRRGSLKSMLAALPSAPQRSQTKLAALEASGRQLHGSLAIHPSVIIDYRATLNTGATLLQGDTTYLVSGAVSCSALTMEGGAVLKYKAGASVTVNSTTPKNSGLYRPVVFTGVDDDTVGESMSGYANSGYTGTISSSGYANPALKLGQLSLTASGCVFRYAQKAIQYAATSASAASITLTHAQLYKCIRGIDLTWAGCGCSGGCSPITLSLNNAVMTGVQYPIYYGNLNCTVSPSLVNCTVDQAANLVGGSGSLSYSAINSVFANITNSTSGTFSGNNNGFYSSSQSFGSSRTTVTSSPFQTVGAGNYYLTDASGFRNAGTSSGVSASLLTDLGKRTTYPPYVVATTTINTPQTYSAQAQRDTDTLDLGYHYDPLDWELGGVLVTNATVTVNVGTAIGVFGTNTSTYGLAIGQAAALQCQGAPNSRVWIAQFNTVQEQPYTNWLQTSGGALSSEFQGLSPGSTIYCRLTSWSTLGMAVPDFYGPTNSGPFNFQDCEFHGGKVVSAQPTVNLTNCLLERAFTDLEPKDGLTTFVRVGLVYGGAFVFGPTNSLVQDVLFDGTSITNWNGYTGGFNAYDTGAQRLLPNQSADIILSAAPSYKVGPLGNYYQVTNSVLINADTSTAAYQVGLYHYTVTTNLVSGYEIKETNSLVDVSYHYVATDANGNPIDTNGDGIPDYLSDVNGDGAVNSGEISWSASGDLGLKVLITRPKNGATIP